MLETNTETEMAKETVLVTGGSGLVGRAIEHQVNHVISSSSPSNQANEIIIRHENQHQSSVGYEKEDEVKYGFANDDDELHDLARLKFVFLSSKDADLTDFNQAKQVFVKHTPSYVINLAARVGGLFINMADRDRGEHEFYRINMAINENVLKLAHEFKVKMCISCLSTCIFADQIELPLDESKIHAGPPHASNSDYAMAKRYVDVLNRHYNSLINKCDPINRKFVSIIPTNVFGPWDNFNLFEGHVVPALIHRIYLAMINGQLQQHLASSHRIKIRLRGTGKPLRQFIYSFDLAKLILWLLINYHDDNEPIILCPDSNDAELSIGQVAHLIGQIMEQRLMSNSKNNQLLIEFDNSIESDGQFKKTASNAKLRSLLGAQRFKFTPFDVALRHSIDWFCCNYPNVRK